LADIEEVKFFADEATEFFSNENSLDCLINNASIIDMDGPNTSSDMFGRFERTFQVNAVAPFILSQRFLKADKVPQRIITTSAQSHIKPGPHKLALDYQNLQFEKGDWDPKVAYYLSKLLNIMMNTGFYYKGMIPSDTTMLAFHPGVYNTKMLLGAYGKVGVEVEEANPTFELATGD